MKKQSVRPAAAWVTNGTVKVAGVLVIVSCAGGPGDDIQRAQPGNTWEVAKAASRDAGEDASVDSSADTPVDHTASADQASEPATTADPPMPANPVHAAFRFRGADKIIPTTNSGAPLPYPHEVMDDGDDKVLIVYLPHKDEGNVGVQVTPVNERLEPVGEPREYTVEPRGRIGTIDVDLSATGGIWKIGSDAEHTLVLGDNTLTGKVTRQFMAGALREVMQGVFKAPTAGTYRIEFSGAEELYSFLDAPPQWQGAPFEVTLKEGQVLALWALVDLSIEAVNVTIAQVAQTCAPPPASE